MMKFIRTVLLSAYLLAPIIAAVETDSATLLVDFISFLKVPLKVALFTCWPDDKSARFARKLFSFNKERPLFVQVKSDSIENLSVLDTLEPHQQLAVVDVSCPRVVEFLKGAGHRIYHRVRWVLLNEGIRNVSDHENRILKTAEKLPITGNSEVLYFVKDDDGDVLIKEVYRASMEENVTSSMIGISRNGTIQDKRMGKAVSERRRNLRMLPLRTTLVYTNNYTRSHFDDYENPHIDMHYRLTYLLLRSLYHSYLNATFEKRYARTFCYPKPNVSEQSDMCADILSNRSDVGGSLIFMTQQRLKMVEFKKLAIDARVAVIFKTPKLSTTENIFRLPFDGPVWGCLIGLILFIGGLFLGASVAERWIGSKPKQGDQLFEAAFEVIQISAQQGLSNDGSKTLAKRALMLVSLIGLMFFEVSFSAKIVSLIQAPSERIASLKDVLDSRLEVGSLDTPYNRYWLPNLAEPIRKALYEQKIRNKDGSMNMIPMEQGMDKVRKELYAFNMDVSGAYKIVSDTFDEAEKCFLRELQWIPTGEGFIVVKLNYTWSEHFNGGLMRILEAGIYSREFHRMSHTKPKCVRPVSFEPLGVIDMRFMLQLMGCGMGTAVGIFVVEKIWRAYYVRRLPLFEYVE